MTALLGVLQKHWGAVQRDLLTAGLHMEGLCEEFTLDELAAFVLNSPPGTAVYHQLTEGWDVGERLQAHCLDALHDLLWAKTRDAHAKPPRNRPKRTWQPGMSQHEKTEDRPNEMTSQVMTVEEYCRRAGIEM